MTCYDLPGSKSHGPLEMAIEDTELQQKKVDTENLENFQSFVIVVLSECNHLPIYKIY